MKNTIKLLSLIFVALVLTSACQKNENNLIGGQKDNYGCLISAGYSWNESIGACIRSWELDESQAKAAQIAIAPFSYRPITIEKVETLRCVGCFIVTLKSYDEKPFEIKLFNWKFSDDMHFCTDEEKKAEICTLEYMPVCGNNGRTYGNKCSACASKEIDFYVQGACEEKTIEKECGSCPLLSQPSPDFCKDGKIIPGEINECGCQGPPKCEPVACTKDAKICPDGTYVGRIAPDCEFAPCPK